MGAVLGEGRVLCQSCALSSPALDPAPTPTHDHHHLPTCLPALLRCACSGMPTRFGMLPSQVRS